MKILGNGCTLSTQDIADVCASVQFCMTRLICRRVQRAIEYCLLNTDSRASVIRNHPTALVRHVFHYTINCVCFIVIIISLCPINLHNVVRPPINATDLYDQTNDA